MRHSQIGSDSIEEFKEARAMFGPTNDSRILTDTELLESGAAEN